MARIEHAVIWTQISGTPKKMGNIALTPDSASFTYDEEYRASGLPGFCLLGDASIWGEDTVIYPISASIPMFPRLMSLVPGSSPRNLQRRHYLELIRAKDGKEPPPGLRTDWKLLLMGGHGGIGHVDIFSDDMSAEKWYQSKSALLDGSALQKRSAKKSQLWRMLKNEVLDENVDFDPQVVEEAIGPTPSVGGMISKMLVSVTPDGKSPVFYKTGTRNKRDVVLKIEPPEYTGVLDLEGVCLDIHEEAGFEVPWHRRYDDEDLHFLAVERFDITEEGLPIPMEPLFSVIAMGDHDFKQTGDIFLDDLANIFDRLGEVLNLAKDSKELLYRRILMALLTGNGDLHLENISILGGINGCRLAPVYDPAPMRAWPKHNMISAIPYDAEEYPDSGAYFSKLGGIFGLTDTETQTCMAEAFDATKTYTKRVANLERVPKKQRNLLISVVKKERHLLSKYMK